MMAARGDNQAHSGPVVDHEGGRKDGGPVHRRGLLIEIDPGFDMGGLGLGVAALLGSRRAPTDGNAVTQWCSGHMLSPIVKQ